GFEGLVLAPEQAALAKAATAAVLSTAGHAFSTRTAGFLMQEHFPPGIDFTAAGPLHGAQFSGLGCGDVRIPGLAFGLSGDPGGFPLYREGRVIGGVAVEGDGLYGVDADTFDQEASWEESAALAGASGFDPPPDVRAERISMEGIRLPYTNVPLDAAAPVPVEGAFLVAPRAAGPSRFAGLAVGDDQGTTVAGASLRGGGVLSLAEVSRLVTQALRQAERTRSAVRRPLNSFAHVTVAVVDADGALLGLFRAADAPVFSADAAVQAARTAAFFSAPGAGDALRRAGLAAFAQDVPLDGAVAYSSRAVGFLAQPYLPPGVPGTDPGPFGVARPPVWSPFHSGLQSELLCGTLGAPDRPASPCTAVPGLPNGLALVPGAVPLFKDGRLAGAVGVSGDGPDQNDLIAAAASVGLEAPPERRSDRVILRGVRLPYLKYPRHPEL
ncbi:MAG TPA: heme-binding protein, partial [Vicinamibacteria bacterium]|nr:heme-binding protein [Vicinamibacteria bacterium]